MNLHAGLATRRAVILGSGLLLAMVLSTATLAQDDPAAENGTAADPAVTEPSETDGSANSATPGRLKQARHPKGGPGLRVFDIIEGGPGYIAVGGGTPTGLDHQSLVWLSDDGLRWQASPLFGDAAAGTMRAVAALPGGGFVAVGHDFEPETERAEMVHAIVWHSLDGYGWQRVPAHESFPGSVMWDVTTTPDGVAAAGCLAGFHCDVGRVWTSTDGFTWELIDDIAMAPYDIAADAEGNLVISGEDDAYDLVAGQAAAASSVDDWTVRVFATGDSQMHGATAYGDGFLLAGTLRDANDASAPASALQVTADGTEWESAGEEQLEQVYAFDIDASGDLVTLVAQDMRKKRTRPLILYGRDLESLEPVKLHKSVKVDRFGGEDVRLTDDGSRLFVFGVSGSRPAIWTTTFQ